MLCPSLQQGLKISQLLFRQGLIEVHIEVCPVLLQEMGEKNFPVEAGRIYPLTGQVVAIGMLNPDTNKGAMYYQAPEGEPMLPMDEDGVKFQVGTEAEILTLFWDTLKNYNTLITFNGRGFDCPFLLVRSAMHKIKPTRDIMPNRYGDAHIDLMDRLSFYGSFRRRFSLDMWCRSFGITSPKEDNITGYQVPEFFRAGRYLDIARYCVRDLHATKELFFYWDQYIRAPKG